MASGVQSRLKTVASAGGASPFDYTSNYAWVRGLACPHCGATQLSRVALVVDANNGIADDLTQWLRCPSCLKGSVYEGGTVYPPVLPLSEPRGLPTLEAKVWADVRKTLSVGAHTAGTMLCRKLLFHIAVEKGLPEKDGKGRAPSFLEALEHLTSEGYITPPMLPWVTRIKDVGNEANHELTPISAEQALDIATFTEQLLILTYEMPARMASQQPVEEVEPVDPE